METHLKMIERIFFHHVYSDWWQVQTVKILAVQMKFYHFSDTGSIREVKGGGVVNGKLCVTENKNNISQKIKLCFMQNKNAFYVSDK